MAELFKRANNANGGYSLEVTFSFSEVSEFLDSYAHLVDLDDPEWVVNMVLGMKRFERGEFENG